MKAILMAGGFGTRMRPLTIKVPKPMVPIGNLPIMEHVVSLLASHGITDITSLLYFSPEVIKDYFGDGSEFGVRMSYCLPDADYGTAGAVRFALGEAKEPVLIISGDLITDFDLTQAMNWHQEKRSEATILLTRTENPLQYGIVITNPDGRISRFLEKPSWGEAFSDTINTGIYVLEPSATALIPHRANFDFSQNLFPLMLSKKMGLYGNIMEGYWKDVGNVSEYHLVHADLAGGKLKLDLKADIKKTDAATLYLGKNVTIGEGVSLEGTVVIRDNVVIEGKSLISDSMIGSNSQIGHNSRITNSILWSDNLIGAETDIDSAIVCRGCMIGNRVKLNDNCIISDDCRIGDGAVVKAGCKIWPDKTVDAGSIVSTSMVWGEKWNRELFTDSKMSGLALTEITPEMAVRLGAALGASLGQGVSVVSSRDASDISRLIRRGLMSGLLSAGVNVSDLETMPIPVVRYALSRGSFAAGIYVRHSPLDYRQLEFIMFDGSGMDMPNAKLKKIERNYFGEDYELATMDEIGHLEKPQGVLVNYRQEFMESIDNDLIRQAGFKVVVDHSNGSSSQIFPALFSKLGVAATELNAYLNPRKFATTPQEQSQAIVQISAIVKSLHADIGFHLNTASEKLTVVDENGEPIDNQLLLALITDLFLQTHKATAIAVPIGATMAIEKVAAMYGTRVIRVPNDHRAMMDVRRQESVDFVGGTRGGFIFPGFQMGADAILATVKILEMMAQTRTRLGELREQFEGYVMDSVSVPCPWSKKGQVMRTLITSTEEKNRQLVDGVRILDDDAAILMTPDRARASFTLQVESESKEKTKGLIAEYSKVLEEAQSD